MNYIQAVIKTTNQEQQEIIIALLSEEGFEGFEELQDSLKAYINADSFNEERLRSITNQWQLSYKTEVVLKQNWNALWESNFQPVTVEDFVAVRADFHQPIKGVTHEIIITPKMSFGTGHHATTYMMMQQMRKLDFMHKTVFDFGTGTGILAILAEKLGAKEICAVDNDEWCIRNARENVNTNNCLNIQVKLGDSLETKPGGYDIILANINRNIILANIHQLVHNLKAGGYLLLSGLLQEDEADILHATKKFNVIHQVTITRDKWICLLFNG